MNYQNKVVEEINEVFGDDDEITMESLNKLQYMERVIKETMRIAPIGPVIFREAMEDFEIEPGKIVPKGTTFVLNIYALHRAPHLWGYEKARVFDPDNFLPENVAKRHPCSYIPFSTGRRNCIGHRYAMISMKIILLKLLRKYKFSTNLKYDELRFKAVLTLKLIGEHLVSIENRF
jgi:cytochrome P450